jgi:hypothetical protein
MNYTMHEMLMKETENAPMKTIVINGEPYLERYYMGEQEQADSGRMCQVWLHRFLRNDSERHLHTHPWHGFSRVLTGWYMEQTPDGMRKLREGQGNEITPETLHRIAMVKPDTWTQLMVLPGRLPTWKFIDDGGNEQTQNASPEDWWKSCKTRGES